MEKIRVLYIHPNGHFSGAAISLYNILQKLDRNKITPYVLICSEGPLLKWYEDLNIEVFCIPYDTYTSTPTPPFWDANFYYNLKALLNKNKISGLLKKLNPDIVHVNDKSALIPGWHAARAGFKVIWHLRSTYFGPNSFLQYKISSWLIRKYSHWLLAISEDEIDCFSDTGKLSVLYNSVDMEVAEKTIQLGSTFREEFDIRPDEFAIGMMGNLDEQKGLSNFIKAAGLIKEMKPEIRFRFFIVAAIPKQINYGWRGKLGLVNTAHPYETAIELVKRNGVENEVVFTDRRSDILNIILGLDIVSAVYNLDAIGRPAIEAAAVGKPVIVNVGNTGKSKMVLHNQTGIIVKKESPVELANTICDLINNPAKMKMIGEQGRHYAKLHFDSAKNCRTLENIYGNLNHK